MRGEAEHRLQFRPLDRRQRDERARDGGEAARRWQSAWRRGLAVGAIAAVVEQQRLPAPTSRRVRDRAAAPRRSAGDSARGAASRRRRGRRRRSSTARRRSAVTVTGSVPLGVGVAQPEGVAIVGDDQVEGAVGLGLERGQRRGGGARIGMIERLQHQFAARALPRRRAERAVPVEDAGERRRNR